MYRIFGNCDTRGNSGTPPGVVVEQIVAYVPQIQKIRYSSWKRPVPVPSTERINGFCKDSFPSQHHNPQTNSDWRPQGVTNTLTYIPWCFANPLGYQCLVSTVILRTTVQCQLGTVKIVNVFRSVGGGGVRNSKNMLAAPILFGSPKTLDFQKLGQLFLDLEEFSLGFSNTAKLQMHKFWKSKIFVKGDSKILGNPTRSTGPWYSRIKFSCYIFT